MKKKRARPAARTAVRPVTLTPRQALWLELMPFYIREAWLLDERKLEAWLDLFTDDVLYFMPRRKNVPRRELHRELTPLGDLAILEEDKRYLQMRVARLDSGMAWAEDPRRAPATWSATARCRWTRGRSGEDRFWSTLAPRDGPQLLSAAARTCGAG